ncbi:LptF/LptG family permease [candidate division KSB1 bacterium]|nr:LptF/LptG family permease [candidate division KSB1 bacterium]
MFTLWRYIIKEHISPFIFAISVITLVFLLNLVFRELGRILSKGLGFSLILEFFFLNMAWIIALAVPMAVLVATLMAFGRLSGDSEITAMKAGGVGILHMIFPVLVVSFFLAGFLVWFNNHVLPDFNHRTRLLASDIARKRPTINLESGVVMKDIPNINILVQKINEAPDTSYVETVFIEDNRTQNKSKYIFAKKGKIYTDPNTGYLFLTLYEGEMHELDLEKMEQYTRLSFPEQKLSIRVPNMTLERSDSEYRGDREKSAQMMREEVIENKKLLKERYQRIDQLITMYFDRHLPLTTPAAMEKNNNRAEREIFKDISKSRERVRQKYIEKLRQDNLRTLQQVTAELNIIKNYDRANYTLMVEVHKKYSIPFACIVFVLIGAPLGIMSRKGNLAVAGGISFGFFLLYWASLIAGEELADNQFISPFIAMWLADIIVGIGGIYLVIHSIHESTFINWTSIQDFFKKIPLLFKNKTKFYENIR